MPVQRPCPQKCLGLFVCEFTGAKLSQTLVRDSQKGSATKGASTSKTPDPFCKPCRWNKGLNERAQGTSALTLFALKGVGDNLSFFTESGPEHHSAYMLTCQVLGCCEGICDILCQYAASSIYRSPLW